MYVRDAVLEWACARDLADTFRRLEISDGVMFTVERVCRLATAHIPGCDDAGMLVAHRGVMETLGATSESPSKVDKLQFHFGEGPSVEVTRFDERAVVGTGDLAADRRWPGFGPVGAAAGGIRSMLAFRLAGPDQIVGALTLYSSRRQAFEPAAVELGTLFSSHASTALVGAQAIQNLKEALESRETISVAMGILMARQEVSREQAFEILKRASQRESVKLREIAARMAGAEKVLP